MTTRLCSVLPVALLLLTACGSDPELVVASVDCQMGEWTEWGECDGWCEGERSRQRSVVTEPEGSGAECPSTTETQACGVLVCVAPDDVSAILATENGSDFGLTRFNEDEWMHLPSGERWELARQTSNELVFRLSEGGRELVFDVVNGEATGAGSGGSSPAAFTLEAVNPEPGNPLVTVRVSYPGGGFVMINSDTWMENAAYGPYRWDWYELDADNIYLADIGRGALGRLDLSTNEFYAAFGENEEERRYYSLNAEVGPMSTWLVKQVVYASGDFTQTGSTRWFDNASDGRHSFDEYDRDADSIWLEDSWNDVFVELDITDGVIRRGPPGNSRFRYTIERTW